MLIGSNVSLNECNAFNYEIGRLKLVFVVFTRVFLLRPINFKIIFFQSLNHMIFLISILFLVTQSKHFTVNSPTGGGVCVVTRCVRLLESVYFPLVARKAIFPEYIQFESKLFCYGTLLFRVSLRVVGDSVADCNRLWNR